MLLNLLDSWFWSGGLMLALASPSEIKSLIDATAEKSFEFQNLR
jgi:hypothetical protein